MRVHIIIEETVFFHPRFLLDLLERTSDDFISASLVAGVGKKNNIERYMVEHFYYLHLSEILKLGWKKTYFTMLNYLDRNSCHTVKSVLKMKNIPFKTVRDNINTPEHIQFIRDRNPDVILSSQSLYFGRDLLALPKICCINRHSSLLPNNGGMWPGFQAVRKGEEETGVSIHMMESKIDAGVVLSQIKVPIQFGETVWDIYKECFEKSTDAVLEALNKIRNNNFSQVQNEYKRDYYSFPTKGQWKEFRKRGGRFV